MISILKLFEDILSWFAIGTQFLPVIFAIIARKRKFVFIFDMKLFEIYVISLLLLQIVALVLSYGFGLYNVWLFRIYIPLSTAFMTYLLLKWSGLNVYSKIVPIIAIISAASDFFWGDPQFVPDIMLWIDSITLLSLSFLLSYRIDKKNIKLPKELSFIHIGIYLSSFLTLIGITPSHSELRIFGFVIQNIATVIANIYFTRSFKCLFP